VTSGNFLEEPYNCDPTNFEVLPISEFELLPILVEPLSDFWELFRGGPLEVLGEPLAEFWELFGWKTLTDYGGCLPVSEFVVFTI